MGKMRHLEIIIAKQRFIDIFQKNYGNITQTCRAVGIDRKTYYNWLKNDKSFAERIADCEADLNDEIRQVLIQKAAEGDMTAVIFYLRRRHPDFKDNPTVLIQQNFTEVVQDERKKFGL